MALSRTSSKSSQTLYKISLKRDDMLENPIFNDGMKNGKIKLLDSKESKIIYERFNEDLILVMNEKDDLVSLKQRIDNECGYYSLISVFFSLIKKRYGKLDINFRNLLIEKATTLGITTDYKGISGGDLEDLINKYFFDSKKVCSYQKGNPLEPRITGMIVKGHWIGQIPQKKSGKSILLEPFSGKIFEADDKYLKKIEDDMLMEYRKTKGNFRNHDHKIYINKKLLFNFYKLFTNDLNLKSNKSSIVLSTIEEGENESSNSSSRSRSSRSRSRSSRSRSRSSRSRRRGNGSRSGGGIRKKNKRTRRRRR